MSQLEAELRRLWVSWEGSPLEFAAVLEVYRAKAKRAAVFLDCAAVVDTEPFALEFDRMEAAVA